MNQVSISGRIPENLWHDLIGLSKLPEDLSEDLDRNESVPFKVTIPQDHDGKVEILGVLDKTSLVHPIPFADQEQAMVARLVFPNGSVMGFVREIEEGSFEFISQEVSPDTIDVWSKKVIGCRVCTMY